MEAVSLKEFIALLMGENKLSEAMFQAGLILACGLLPHLQTYTDKLKEKINSGEVSQIRDIISRMQENTFVEIVRENQGDFAIFNEVTIAGVRDNFIDRLRNIITLMNSISQLAERDISKQDEILLGRSLINLEAFVEELRKRITSEFLDGQAKLVWGKIINFRDFKQVLEYIQAQTSNIWPQDIKEKQAQNILIRIIKDTIGLSEDDNLAKPQVMALKEVIYPSSEQARTSQIRNYYGVYKWSILPMYALSYEIKGKLKQGSPKELALVSPVFSGIYSLGRYAVDEEIRQYWTSKNPESLERLAKLFIAAEPLSKDNKNWLARAFFYSLLSDSLKVADKEITQTEVNTVIGEVAGKIKGRASSALVGDVVPRLGQEVIDNYLKRFGQVGALINMETSSSLIEASHDILRQLVVRGRKIKVAGSALAYTAKDLTLSQVRIISSVGIVDYRGPPVSRTAGVRRGFAALPRGGYAAENSSFGLMRRVVSGARPLIRTFTMGLPSLTAFSASARLYLDSARSVSSINTITASGGILSPTAGLSSRNLPNSVESSMFFLIRNSLFISRLLQKLFAVYLPIILKVFIRKVKGFFKISDKQGNFIFSPIRMNDVFVRKAMSSIIPHYGLPPVFYTDFQLQSERRNFIFPVSMDMPQLSIVVQRNNILNSFNHIIKDTMDFRESQGNRGQTLSRRKAGIPALPGKREKKEISSSSVVSAREKIWVIEFLARGRKTKLSIQRETFVLDEAGARAHAFIYLRKFGSKKAAAFIYYELNKAQKNVEKEIHSASPLTDSNAGSEEGRAASPTDTLVLRLFYNLLNSLRNWREFMMEMPRNGLSTSKSSSLLIIILALQATAVSKIMLSEASRQKVILISGLTIMALSLMISKSSFISLKFNLRRGLIRTLRRFSSISEQKAGIISPSLIASYIVLSALLVNNALTNTFKSTTMMPFIILPFYFLANALYLLSRNLSASYSSAHSICYIINPAGESFFFKFANKMKLIFKRQFFYQIFHLAGTYFKTYVAVHFQHPLLFKFRLNLQGSQGEFIELKGLTIASKDFSANTISSSLEVKEKDTALVYIFFRQDNMRGVSSMPILPGCLVGANASVGHKAGAGSAIKMINKSYVFNVSSALRRTNGQDTTSGRKRLKDLISYNYSQGPPEQSAGRLFTTDVLSARGLFFWEDGAKEGLLLPVIIASSSSVEQADESVEVTRPIIEIDARASFPIHDDFIEWLSSLLGGYGGIAWFKAVWARSLRSKHIMPIWQEYNKEKGVRRIPSGYDVSKYELDPAIAETDDIFKALTWKLKNKGIISGLDFVTNHISSDSEYIRNIPGLCFTYDDKGYLEAVRRNENRCAENKDGIPKTDDEIRLMLQPWPVSMPYPFYLYPLDQQKMIYTIARYAKHTRGEPPMYSLAQINYSDERARNFMKGPQVLGKIAELTHNGALRADLAHTALWLHVRNEWLRHLSDEEARKIMPREFWDEFKEEKDRKYPQMIIFAETYEADSHKEVHPWEGRAGRLQEFGFKTYHKHLYDLMCSGDVKDLRGYLLKDCLTAPNNFLANSVNFAQNHDEWDILDIMTLEKAMAATMLILAIEGYPLIPLRQIYGMRKPESAKTEMKSGDGAIYEFRYPSRGQADQNTVGFFEKFLPLMSGPIFRASQMFGPYLEKPSEDALGGLIPVGRCLNNQGVGLAMVNYSDEPEKKATINLNNLFDYYKTCPTFIKHLPRENIKIYTSDGSHCFQREDRLHFTLGSWGYVIVTIQKNSSSSAINQEPGISRNTLYQIALNASVEGMGWAGFFYNGMYGTYKT
ncbi:MAG TPA: hypothetical protein DCL49_09210, partial [Candidatus Omnitrophica bacterium]|nr:hypothetical protein [Candidatus Omnitrophota bacterium]